MENKIPTKYSDKQIHISDQKYAWKKKDILEFIDDPCSHGFAILGGDVLHYDTNKQSYSYTYDSWYINRNGPMESFSDYCTRSKQKTKEYIQNYRFEDGIVFLAVISSEVTAGL